MDKGFDQTFGGCRLPRLFLFLILLGYLGSPALAGQEKLPLPQDSIRYYEAILRTGHAPIKTFAPAKHWVSITLNNHQPEVREFLRRQQAQLAQFKECYVCDLTLAAYLSSSPAAQQQAVTLARQLWPEFRPKTSHLFSAYLSYLNSADDITQDKVSLDRFATYWKELNLPLEVYTQALSPSLLSGPNPTGKSWHTLASEILATQLGGKPQLDKWLDEQIKGRVETTIQGLRAFVESNDVPDKYYSTDAWLSFAHSWAKNFPFIRQLAKTIPADLLFEAYKKSFIEREFAAPTIPLQLLYILTLSENTSVIAQAKACITLNDPSRSKQLLLHFYSLLSESLNLQYSAYLPAPLQKTFSARIVNLKDTVMDQKQFLPVSLIASLFSYHSPSAPLEKLPHFLDLLGLSYEDFQFYTNIIAHNPNCKYYEANRHFVTALKGPKEFERLRQNIKNDRLTQATHFLSVVSDPQTTNLLNAPIDSHLYNAFTHVEDVQIQSQLIKHQKAIFKLRPSSRWILFGAAKGSHSGFLEMISNWIDFRVRNKLLLPIPKEGLVTRLMIIQDLIQVASAASYEAVVTPALLESAATLLAQLPDLQQEPGLEMLRDTVETLANPESTVRLAQMILKKIDPGAVTLGRTQLSALKTKQRQRSWFSPQKYMFDSLTKAFEKDTSPVLAVTYSQTLTSTYYGEKALESHSPQAQAFLKENLPALTLSVGQPLTAFLWYMCLSAGNNENSWAQALALIRYRVMGNDPLFNELWYSNANTPWKHFRIIFDQLSQSLDIGGWTNQVQNLLVQFVLDLQLPYSLMGPHLENIYWTTPNPAQKRVAQTLIVEQMGISYFKTLTPRPSEEKVSFLYVNGGYDELSNYATNEEDLKSFHYKLFGSKTLVLNAGGPGGTVIPDTLPRDENGLLVLKPGLKLDKPFRAASRKNLDLVFKEIKATNPTALTAIFGDHGGPNTLALWGQDTLTAKDLQNSYAQFPEQTLVRSLFLQCFGATMIVPQDRKVPTKLALLTPFFKQNYPKNRCALANARHDELGVYYQFGQTWEVGRWTWLFRYKRHISLRYLKDFMTAENYLDSTPALTSDYFIDDMIQVFCQEAQHFAKLEPKHGHDGHFSRLDQRIRTASAKTLCDTSKKEELESLEAKVIEATERLSGLQRRRNMIRRAVIEEMHPQVYKKYLEGQRLRDSVLKKYLGPGLGPEGISKKDKLRIKEIRDQYIFPYLHQAESIRHDPEYDQAVNKKTVEFLEQHPDKIEQWQAANYLDLIKRKSRALKFAKMKLSAQMKSAQRDRKKLQGNLYKERRLALESLLQDPLLQPIKARYENILECENSIITQ